MPKRKPSQRRHPEKTPQQPRDRLAEIRAEIQDVQQQIETKRRDGHVIRTAEDFKSLDGAIAALTDPTVGPPDGRGDASRSRRLGNRGQARSLAQGAGHTIKDQGRRDVTLRTTCRQVIVRATYFSRNCDRSKASKGMYPMLLLWGVQDRCTAAIVSEISKLVAMLSWLEEVEQVLSDRGRPLDYQDHSDDRLSFRHACPGRPACRGLELGRDRRGPSRGRLHRWRPDSDSHNQARSQDGQGTQPLSHGLAQPKLLIIYVVDEKGQMDREFLAVIDGTLGGPDAIFKLLEFYLRELKDWRERTRSCSSPMEPVGSRNRVGALLRRLGVKPDQVNELVDFYHAVEHLGKIAALQHRWTAAERQAWIGRQRRRLLKGGAEEVRAAIDAVCGSRPGKALKREARILQTERRKRSDGLRTDSSVEVADWQWCDRECDSPCREPAVEGAEHLLAQDDCGGRSAVTFVLQGGTLESS